MLLLLLLMMMVMMIMMITMITKKSPVSRNSSAVMDMRRTTVGRLRLHIVITGCCTD